MYRDSEGRDVEDICYELEHVEIVKKSIQENFDKYFDGFIETCAGEALDNKSFHDLQKKFGILISPNAATDLSQNYKMIIRDSIEEFEKDRQDYLEIFDEELLEETLEDDALSFKSKTLRNECPIIRKTLNNRSAKELDKYRASFSRADAEELLTVVLNLCQFSNEYYSEYDPNTYEEISSYEDMELDILDTKDYTAFGVIGGGIKTHMLYKVHPSVFPNRSRSALWALWFLTDKQKFGCNTDSEFLMIDINKNITQQNYFYPYVLFAYYAFVIYELLRDKASDYSVYIDPDYRYVVVDSFFEYVTMRHDDEISFLKSQIRDGGMGFA